MIRLEVLGRLTKDVEVRISEKGMAIARFTIAVNEGKDKTSFHDFTAFGKVAETLANHTKKGQMIFVDNATINNNQYEKDGVKHYTKELIAYSFRFC